MTKGIPLSQGKIALVSDEDFDRISAFRWYASHGYAATNVPLTNGCKKIWMHREIIGAPIGQQVDHINRNTLDNRRENLRIATQQQNNFNRSYRRRSASGFRGVTWHKKARRWQASVKHEGRMHYLGLFDDPEHAARVYDEKARDLFGSFARLNFPNPGEEAAA